MTTITEQIKTHLEAGGVVQVTTYLKSTLYTAKHAAWFSEDASGSTFVRHGRGKVQLTIGNKALVGIKFGRYEVTN